MDAADDAAVAALDEDEVDQLLGLLRKVRWVE